MQNVKLHIRIVWPIAPLRDGPINILARVFYVAAFTMYAILKVDDKLLFAIFHYYFVYARWAISLCGFGVFRQVNRDGDACVFEVQMGGLAFFMIGEAECNVSQPIK